MRRRKVLLNSQWAPNSLSNLSREGDGWGFGVGRGKLFHFGWISNEVLLYSTGNSIRSLGIDHDGS